MSEPATTRALTVTACDSDYPRMRVFVEQACTQAGCSASLTLRVLLVTEELFTNTVKYGQQGAEPIAVTITIAGGKTGTTVSYEDNAPTYDPFAGYAPGPELEGTVRKRSIGRLGILIIQELGKDVRYERIGGRNRITFTLHEDNTRRSG
jgi:anti-sigma regulatory factor (Ser/Thr protein kinase)